MRLRYPGLALGHELTLSRRESAASERSSLGSEESSFNNGGSSCNGGRSSRGGGGAGEEVADAERMASVEGEPQQRKLSMDQKLKMAATERDAQEINSLTSGKSKPQTPRWLDASQLSEAEKACLSAAAESVRDGQEGP